MELSIPIYVYDRFSGKNYNSSEALVITFVVNNHLDEDMNKKAEAWEKAFIEFMKSFSSPNMTVSYSSEVSLVMVQLK